MKSKSILVLFLVIIFFRNAFSQDVHFSQEEYSPLNLNPGLAGANSPVQAILNYRSQWSNVAAPYKTFGASFDARLNEKKRNKKGVFAIGVNLFSDESGELKMKTTLANLNLAYHLILNRSNKLGIGLYGGGGQRSIDPNVGRWGSQYDGNEYNASLSSGETFNSASLTYFDAGAGIVYTHKSGEGYMTQNKGIEFQCGFAMYHVNKPGTSFINKTDDHLFVRYSSFANAKIGINNTKGSFLPGIYVQRQRSSMEIMYGFYYQYKLKEGTRYTGFNLPMTLNIGLFNRFKDAMIAKFMFEFDMYSLGLSYDFTISDLNALKKSQGGFELFLRFNFNDGGGFRGGTGFRRSRIQ